MLSKGGPEFNQIFSLRVPNLRNREIRPFWTAEEHPSKLPFNIT